MKPLIIISIILLVGLVIWILGSLYAVNSLEEPKYEILEKKSGYEIRKYANYIVAEVEVSGSQNDALNTGFRQLAGYIFGGNTGKSSIAMTAPVSETQIESTQIAMTVPVSETPTSNNKRIVQFSMPSKYTLETLPQPDNKSVKLKQIDGYKAAVLSYTGYATEKRVEAKKAQLAELLQSDGIETIGEMVSAQYNPPLSFPFVRRNEIIITIK